MNETWTPRRRDELLTRISRATVFSGAAALVATAGVSYGLATATGTVLASSSTATSTTPVATPTATATAPTAAATAVVTTPATAVTATKAAAVVSSGGS